MSDDAAGLAVRASFRITTKQGGVTNDLLASYRAYQRDYLEAV